MHSVKKRFKTCVDEMMQKFDISINDYNTELYLFLQNDANDNKLNNTIEMCDESERKDIHNNENNPDHRKY